MLDADLLVAHYRQFFALFDWSVVARWLASQSTCCGSHGHSLSAYLKAFLLRIKEGLRYSTDLRRFLLLHPLLVIELGFVLHLDASALTALMSRRACPRATGWARNGENSIAACSLTCWPHRARLEGRNSRPGRDAGC